MSTRSDQRVLALAAKIISIQELAGKPKVSNGFIKLLKSNKEREVAGR